MSQDLRSEHDAKSGGHRHLSFSLGAEDYAIPLLSVKEVIAVPEITPLPFSPAYFLGIMNLRGQVISVIDLRQKFGIKPKAGSENAVIICDLGPISLGVVVDSINSVLSPDAADISEKPDTPNSANTDYIIGIYKKQEKLVVFLDINRALGPDGRQMAQQAATKKIA